MSKTQRTFIVGDSWLYYKIYTGAKTADLVLTEIIKPVTEELLKAGIIDKWFFIRFADPKPHIRVRFHYTKPEHIAPVINTLFPKLKSFVDEDLIWKIQLDTYQRELKRYGEERIEEAEYLFFRESEMIVKFLSVIDGEEGETIRWLFALRAMDTLLGDFGYSEDEKLAIMDDLKTGFGMEFGMNKHLKKQLDKKYKDQKLRITQFMNFTKEELPEYEVLLEILNEKSKATKQCIQVLQSKLPQEDRDGLLKSYIHMLMNRMFRSKNRLHEMTIYNLSYRYHKVAWGIRTYKQK